MKGNIAGVLVLAIAVVIVIVGIRGTYKTLFPGLFSPAIDLNRPSIDTSAGTPSPPPAGMCVECPALTWNIPGTGMCIGAGMVIVPGTLVKCK